MSINELGTKEIMTGHREKWFWTHCCCFYSTIILSELVTVTHLMPLQGYPENKEEIL